MWCVAETTECVAETRRFGLHSVTFGFVIEFGVSDEMHFQLVAVDTVFDHGHQCMEEGRERCRVNIRVQKP